MINIKEQYFTSSSLDKVASDFLEELEPFRLKHKKQIFIPDNAALIVIDMQDVFLQSTSHAFIPSMEAIVPRVKGLQRFFLEHNRPVFQTWHGNTKQDAAQMFNWWGSYIDVSDSSNKIINELNDPLVTKIHKTKYDSFSGTNLLDQLKRSSVTQVVITGVMSHLCCETTARAAFMYGF